MKDILVTGGSGFIGGYVVEELHKRGYVAYTLDRKAEDWSRLRSGSVPLSQLQPHSIFGDIKDATLVNDAVSHVDGVIHLAGVLGTQETVENPIPAAETNILGGLNVLTACAQYDVPLINIAVGNWWMNNTYSITKNSVERLVAMTAKYRGKVMGSVRALNAYGPRQVAAAPFGPSRVRKIMPSFICRALSGQPIEIYGDGDQIMDMIYVEDVAFILVSALQHLSQHGTIPLIDAGTGRATTVKEIAQTVAACVKEKTGDQVEVSHLPMRPGEDEHSIVLADPTALGTLGMTTQMLTSLEDGVGWTTDYFRVYLADR